MKITSSKKTTLIILKKATNFRIWATRILKEYIIKGVVMDDERLKNHNYIFGEDFIKK